jgi:hypothetical protein
MVRKTQAFNLYKEPGTLKSYFSISQRFLSYFYRVIFPNKYYFNIKDTDKQAERLEDIIAATNKQLAVWNNI